jgi:DNA-binding HxlR family transcriptional regulator
MNETSGLHAALEQVGDRWSLLVVSALLDGPRRFNDLQDDVGGIATNVLSQRLKHLEREGLVVARPYSARPVRLAYELTATGSALAGALRLLAHWGDDRRGPRQRHAPGVHHAACGTIVEPRWFCPTCERTVDDAELDEVRWV